MGPQNEVKTRTIKSINGVRLLATHWTEACQASLSITNTQTHVHCVSDAIQSAHPMSSSSLPAFNLSQHQGFF